MKTFVDFHSLKWGTAAWLVLFLCCLLVVWYKRKEWQRGYDLLFWLPVTGLIVIYCPLVYTILVPRFLPDFGEYERLGWVLLVVPLLGFTFTALFVEQKNRSGKLVWIIACAALILMIGRPNNGQWFIKPQNRYKVSQNAVDTADIIQQDTGDDQVKVSIQLAADLHRKSDQYEDYLLYFGIRQYKGRFHLLPCIVPPNTYDDKDFSLKGKLSKKSDYYIGPKGIAPVTKELTRLGYKKIGENAHYHVYRNQRRYDARQTAKGDTP